MDEDVLTMSSNPFATVAAIARKEIVAEYLSDKELINYSIFKQELYHLTKKNNSMNIFEYYIEERNEQLIKTLLLDTDFSDEKIAKVVDVHIEKVEDARRYSKQ